MGGSPSPGTSTTTVQQSPQQQALEQAGMPLVNQFVDSYNGGGVKSPGAAPTTAAQTQGQNDILQSAAPGGSISNAANETAAANSSLLNATDVKNNPALQGYIDTANQAADQNFKTNVIPGLRTDAVSAGGLGGTRSTLAQNAATNSYLLDRNNTTNSILNNAYNSGLNAMVAGVNAAPNTMRALTFPGTAEDAVGSEQQDQQNAENQALFQSQMLPLTLAGQMFQYASGLPSLGTSTTTTPSSPTSLIGRLFG